MKLEVKSFLSTVLTGMIFIVGCAPTGTRDDIPLSSKDLIDQNVVYKSETVKVDVEEIVIPKPDFARPDKIQMEVTEEVAEIKEVKEDIKPTTPSTLKEDEKVAVIVIPPAKTDAVIDITTTSYGETSIPTELNEFEMAVLEAQEARGIKTKPVVKKVNVSKKEDIKETTSKPFNKKLDVKPIEQVKDITFLSTVVYHSNGKADISSRDMTALKNVVKFANKNDAIIRIVGNSSSRSRNMKEIQNKLVNFDLSFTRATKVRDALVKLGLKKDKVYISAAADTEKIVEENMPINEAINRRTEIYINY